MFMKSIEHSLLLVLAKASNYQFARLSIAYCQLIKKLALNPELEPLATNSEAIQSDTDDDTDTDSNSTALEDEYSSEELFNSDDEEFIN
jgi:hypothetical protein